MSDDKRKPRGKFLTATTTVRHIKPRARGTGRGQGVRRRQISVKDALLNAFDKVGGEDYLLLMARKEPKVFLAMLTKLLPTKVEADDALAAAVVQVITGVPRNPTDPVTIDAEAQEVPTSDAVH